MNEENIEKLSQVIDEMNILTSKECYKFKVVDGVIKLTDTKLGGNPYVPINEGQVRNEYGEVLPLLIQINLDNIEMEHFPNKGMLQIFVEKTIEYPPKYVIKYYENINYNEYLEVFEKMDLSNYFVKDEIKLELVKEKVNMPMYDYRYEEIFLELLSKKFNKKITSIDSIGDFLDYDLVCGMISEKTKILSGSLGGYVSAFQYDSRKVNNKISNYECLLQFDSSLDDRIKIGSAGLCCLLIDYDDLEKKDFTKAVLELDCM